MAVHAIFQTVNLKIKQQQTSVQKVTFHLIKGYVLRYKIQPYNTQQKTDVRIKNIQYKVKK